jgi:hypothetical protein
VNRWAVSVGPGILIALASAIGVAGCNAIWGIETLTVVSTDGSASDAGDWCEAHAPTATSCDDFDHGFPGSGWEVVSAPGSVQGSHGEPDDHVFVSSPRGFTATTPATPAAEGAYAQWMLQQGFGTPTRRLTFSFAVRVDTADSVASGGYLTFANVSFAGGGSSHYSAGIALDGTGLYLLEVPSSSSSDSGTPSHLLLPTSELKLKTWWSLEIDLLYGAAASPTLSVSMSGSPLLSDFAPTDPNAFGEVTLTFGASYVFEGSAPQTAHFDDFVVNVK